MFQPPRRVLFGAAYYYEYQPYERLKDDLDLMAEAHFNVIRVGESVWSTWEPENGASNSTGSSRSWTARTSAASP